MKSVIVSVFNNNRMVFGTEYEINGSLTQSDLKEIVKDSLSRCDKHWTKCGIEDDRGIMLAIFDNKLNKIPVINPNEEYRKLIFS